MKVISLSRWNFERSVKYHSTIHLEEWMQLLQKHNITRTLQLGDVVFDKKAASSIEMRSALETKCSMDPQLKI